MAHARFWVSILLTSSLAGCAAEPEGDRPTWGAADLYPGDDGAADTWSTTACSGWTAAGETLGALADNLEVVVDKEHALPSNYAPPDIVDLSSVGRGLTGNLRREAATQLAAMVEAARTEAGITNLSVLSSYRSFQTQCGTFSHWVSFEQGQGYGLDEAIRRASAYSARPGHSEHQLGLAVDVTTTSLGSSVFNIDFINDTREGAWLHANSWRFGFVLSYPSGYQECTGYQYEGWHYRYVGLDPAAAWNETGGAYIPYEFLRGQTCAGAEVPGRPLGGPGYQLPLDPQDEDSTPAETPDEAPAEACQALVVPGVDTCSGAWLLNCGAERWDYCQLGCTTAGYGEDDACVTPASLNPTHDPAVLCQRYADAAHPSGINTCSAAYAGWLLVCEARADEADTPPEWRYCSNGCQSAPVGSHDACAAE